MGDENDRRRPPGRREASLFVGSDIEPLPFGRSRNLSLTGVFLETTARPAIGEERELSLAWGAEIYSCRARVVRHADDGVALVFIEPDTFFEQILHEIVESSPPVDIIPGR